MPAKNTASKQSASLTLTIWYSRIASFSSFESGHPSNACIPYASYVSVAAIRGVFGPILCVGCLASAGVGVALCGWQGGRGNLGEKQRRPMTTRSQNNNSTITSSSSMYTPVEPTKQPWRQRALAGSQLENAPAPAHQSRPQWSVAAQRGAR